MGSKVRVTNPPEFYAHYLQVGEIHDITGHTEHGVEINHDYFLYNHEFQWVEESHESKLSLNDGDGNYDTAHPHLKPIIKETNRYEISHESASIIIEHFLSNNGYKLSGSVKYDDTIKKFIVNKV